MRAGRDTPRLAVRIGGLLEVPGGPRRYRVSSISRISGSPPHLSGPTFAGLRNASRNSVHVADPPDRSRLASLISQTARRPGQATSGTSRSASGARDQI